jgi:electron transfer flavoprotein beta subunit
VIGVCWKWVAAGDDERWAGVSESDRAALEVALGIAEVVGEPVTVVSAGGAGADAGLREAMAVGAARAVRVDTPADVESAAVAHALAAVLTGASWVVCGDASADRGSGAVPAFLAAELRASQALGLVSVAPAADGMRATRRLDGGRRELLAIAAPAVLSVEGAAARLRRASLPAELAARRATIEVVPGPTSPVQHPDAAQRYRPRARVLAAPAGGALARVLQLTDAAGTTSTTHELVTLDPADAATRILAALTEWGYLGPGSTGAAARPG